MRLLHVPRRTWVNKVQERPVKHICTEKDGVIVKCCVRMEYGQPTLVHTLHKGETDRVWLPGPFPAGVSVSPTSSGWCSTESICTLFNHMEDAVPPPHKWCVLSDSAPQHYTEHTMTCLRAAFPRLALVFVAKKNHWYLPAVGRCLHAARDSKCDTDFQCRLRADGAAGFDTSWLRG